MLSQQLQQGQKSTIQISESLDHSFKANKPERVVDEQNVLAVQSVERRAKKIRQYKTKPVRRIRLIQFFGQGGLRTENEMRRKGLNGSNHRETHPDMKEMFMMGVICPLELSNGKYCDLTKFGKFIESILLNDPKANILLKVLGLPTTYDFEGNREFGKFIASLLSDDPNADIILKVLGLSHDV